MKLRKKIGIGLGIIGIVSVGLGAGLQVYKECKKKNEDIEVMREIKEKGY